MAKPLYLDAKLGELGRQGGVVGPNRNQRIPFDHLLECGGVDRFGLRGERLPERRADSRRTLALRSARVSAVRLFDGALEASGRLNDVSLFAHDPILPD